MKRNGMEKMRSVGGENMKNNGTKMKKHLVIVMKNWGRMTINNSWDRTRPDAHTLAPLA